MSRTRRFFRTLRLAFWRAFTHDAFGIAKGAAYSSIITLFPGLLLAASIISLTHRRAEYTSEISYAVTRIFPAGTAAMAQAYFESTYRAPVKVLITTSLIILWTGSGVMISWMEGFRAAYQLPKTWGLLKERLIAFSLVVMAGIPLAFAMVLVAFGNQIERWMSYQAGHELAPAIVFVWMVLRWAISGATSIAVITLVYHHAVPRTLRWHSVLPGATLATVLWFPATLLFGLYVNRIAQYSLLYGSMAAAIVTLVWMYIISVVILIGAEFNALLYPRLVASGETATPTQVHAG